LNVACAIERSSFDQLPWRILLRVHPVSGGLGLARGCEDRPQVVAQCIE
jgi:hypothetical protein